jgi:hypothetical protein
MTQVSMTFTFDSHEAAAAFLMGNGKSVSTPATSAPSPARTERTAEAAPAAAPATKALDFDKDVVPKLKALHTKDKAKFGEVMKKYGFGKITDVQAKPDAWPDLIAACE